MEICRLDWHIAPFRADRWLDLWEPAAAKVTAYGAHSWSLTRDTNDPLAFQQSMLWEQRSDFERYWYSDEISAVRQQILAWHPAPILATWHTLMAAETVSGTTNL